MIISGKKIQTHLNKDIFIEPFSKSRLNPNSYNLRLHKELFVYENTHLDMKKHHALRPISIPNDGIELKPNTLYLGRTIEYTKTYNFVPMLEGRSSIGRLGLYVHVTAGFGDVGFEGYWTLEMHCIQSLKIYADIEICQVFYHTIDGDYDAYTSSKYHKNSGVQGSQLYQELQ